jgi:hypothetical protein
MSKSFFTQFKYQFQNSELFPGSDVVRRFTRKIIDVRDSYALLAKENNRLAAAFADTRGKSALFRVKDCFECLSPHNTAVVI